MRRGSGPSFVHVLCALCAITLLVPASVAARPCSTLAHLAMARRDDVRAAIGSTQRPADEDVRATFDSSIHPLRVHAGPGADDGRAMLALGLLEAAWDAQVVGAGFPEPEPDGVAGGDGRFDVYLVPLPASVGGMTVATGDVDPRDPRRTSPAFMLLDPTLPDDLLEVYGAHELQHALQFALDTGENLLWSEASAVFWEVRTRPDVTDWHRALPDFQGNPQAPLFATGADLEGIEARPAARYEYGAVLFALYLDEVHGDGRGSLLREVWERSATPSALGANEPDFLDALAAVGVDPSDAVADFAGWRALVGPWAVANDGPWEPVPAAALLGGLRLDAATLDGEEEITADGPYATGCVVRAVAAPANVEEMPVAVSAEAVDSDRQISLVVLVVEPGAPRAARSHTAPGRAHAVELSVPVGATLQVAVCDVAAADAEDDLVLHPVRLSIRRADMEFPDAGGPAEDAGVPADAGQPPPAPAPGPSCQSAAGDPRSMRTAIGVFGLFVGVVGLGIRGYRMWKRKRLYRRK